MTIKKRIFVAGLIGIVLTLLTACGGKTSDETSAHTNETGDIAVKIVFDPSPDIAPAQGKAFSTCREINTVTAQVFDNSGAKLSELHKWPCHKREGTISGILEGLRMVTVQGVWIDNAGHETVFYKGNATLTVTAGKNNSVVVNASFVNFPELTPDQLEQLKLLADQDDDNYTVGDGDCDDFNKAINPGVLETCNGIDDNCDGQVDEVCPWNKTYGKSDSYDNAKSVVQSNDGGYVIAGNSESSARIFKIDENGNRLWNYIYDNITVRAIIQGNSGGYVIIGDSQSSALVFKITENGSKYWDQSFDFALANAIIRSNDGGYVIAGQGNPDTDNDNINHAQVVKIDNSGNVLWTGIFGKTGSSTARAVIPGNNKGYTIAGCIDNEDISNAWVFTIDEDGNPLLNLILENQDFICAEAITPGTNGGYVITGPTDFTEERSNDARIIKIDENGTILWNYTYGGVGVDEFYSIIPANEGGYVLSGLTQYSSPSSYPLTRACILKIEEDGKNLAWNRTYGIRSGDLFSSVISCNNNSGYIVAGETTIETDDWDAWILKVDEDGIAPESPIPGN